MSPRPHPGAARGFTLLEVIVAVFIAALSLAALSQLFSTGVRSADLASRYARATTVAETLLASAGIETPLQDGTLSGRTDNDRLAWSLHIEDEPAAGLDGPVPPPYLLKRLVATVQLLEDEAGAGPERSVTLTTLRLLPQPETGR